MATKAELDAARKLVADHDAARKKRHAERQTLRERILRFISIWRQAGYEYAEWAPKIETLRRVNELLEADMRSQGFSPDGEDWSWSGQAKFRRAKEQLWAEERDWPDDAQTTPLRKD